MMVNAVRIGITSKKVLPNYRCFNSEFNIIINTCGKFQALEEDVVENHNNLLLSLETWLRQDASLLEITNEVDYDQDGMVGFICLKI